MDNDIAQTKSRLDKKEHRFIHTPVFKAILQISIPGLIMMLGFALYSVVDVVISLYFGTISSSDPSKVLTAVDIRTAISSTQSINTMCFALIGCLAIGSASRIPILLGKKDNNLKPFIGSSISSLFFCSILVIAIFSPLSGSLINSQIIHSSQSGNANLETVRNYAWWYINIFIWGIPLYAFSFYSGSLLRNEGFIYISIVANVISNILNGIGDFIFLKYFHWSLIGSAVSTDISWLIALLIMYSYVLYRRNEVVFLDAFKFLKIRWGYVSVIVLMGLSTLIRNAGMSFNAYLVNIFLNHLPPPPKYANNPMFHGFYLSLFGAIGQIIMITVMPLFGVIQSSSSFIGYNFGKKEYKRIRKAIWAILIVAASYLVLIELFIMVLPNVFLDLFEGDTNGIPNLAEYQIMYHSVGDIILRVIFSLFPLLGIQIMAQAILQSLNKPIQSIIAASLRSFIVFIPVAVTLYLIETHITITGNWWLLFFFSWTITDIISSLISFFMGRNIYHNLEHIKIIGIDKQKIAISTD